MQYGAKAPRSSDRRPRFDLIVGDFFAERKTTHYKLVYDFIFKRL
jgi:hypothetical protein